MISDEYRVLQRSLHETDPNYGISSARRVPDILGVQEQFHCETILDYGAGKGLLKAGIGDCVREYDPGIIGKDGEPEPADLVVCTDVLEHIEPDRLDDVLRHIHSLTRKYFYFSVALAPAAKTLADGRNAHLIVESANWWIEKIGEYFLLEKVEESEKFELTGLCRPVHIVGKVKAVGVMREERIEHVRKNVIKTPKRIPDAPLPPHPGIALIANYGPSLNDSFELLEKQRKKLRGATLVTVSGAHDFLRKRNLTPDLHIECDPRAHKGKMMRKRSTNTRYYMASCCHPDVIEMLDGYDLTLWHLYNGPESFEIRDIRSEETAAMIPGGGSVGLRTITLLYFLGYRNFIIHGMDCSFVEGEQHAGKHTGKVQRQISVRPAVMINGKSIKSDKEYQTSPVLISYANHMLKDLRIGRYPACNFYWYGNGLFQEMLRLQNMQMQALHDGQVSEGKQPSYGEPKDYFSMNDNDVAQFEQENAA